MRDRRATLCPSSQSWERHGGTSSSPSASNLLGFPFIYFCEFCRNRTAEEKSEGKGGKAPLGDGDTQTSDSPAPVPPAHLQTPQQPAGPQPTSCPGLASAASRQGPVAEAGEALPPSRRPDVAVVTVDQNLPERLALDSERTRRAWLEVKEQVNEQQSQQEHRPAIALRAAVEGDGDPRDLEEFTPHLPVVQGCLGHRVCLQWDLWVPSAANGGSPGFILKLSGQILFSKRLFTFVFFLFLVKNYCLRFQCQ